MSIDSTGLTRAQFMTSLSALSLALATGGCEQIAQEIAHRPTRKNIAGLASNDPILTTYRNAIAQMQALPMSDVFNWDSQANIHYNNCPHGNWWLLPWHSAYLVYFERIVRKLTGDSTFAIPYWNWADNNGVPGVFYNNDVLNDHTDSASHITISPEFVAHSVLEPIMAETNFELFASGKVTGKRDMGVEGPLEATPHNNVHTTFPQSGDMYKFISPRDPIFWSHHSMLDYCWVDWQFGRGNQNTSDPAWASMTFTEFVDENRQPVSIEAGITPLFAIFDYQYEPSQIGLTTDAIKAIKTKGDAAKLKTIVQRGAPSTLPILQRFALTKETTVNVGAAALGRVPAPKAALDAAARTRSGQRLLLTLQHVAPPASNEVFVRVFINAPGPVNDQTPITDPHYAGSFSFFSMIGMTAGPPSFIVDVTDALRRVGAGDAPRRPTRRRALSRPRGAVSGLHRGRAGVGDRPASSSGKESLIGRAFIPAAAALAAASCGLAQTCHVQLDRAAPTRTCALPDPPPAVAAIPVRPLANPRSAPIGVRIVFVSATGAAIRQTAVSLYPVDRPQTFAARIPPGAKRLTFTLIPGPAPLAIDVGPVRWRESP